MDVTLQWLRCAGPIAVRAAQSYGNHCAKITWYAAFATLQKAECEHLDTVAKCMVAVPTTEEVIGLLRHTWRGNNVFLSDFWSVVVRMSCCPLSARAWR